MAELARWRRLLAPLLLLSFVLLKAGGRQAGAQAPGVPTAELEAARPLTFASDTDSNSPAAWGLSGGRNYLYILNSTAGQSRRSFGLAIEKVASPATVRWSPSAPPGGAWMEAIVPDPSGNPWYGFYHNELADVVCPGTGKVIPRIGAARSGDRGLTWRDLGVVLEAPPATERCDTSNHYFVGGVGDFSVILDQDQKYLYFFYTQYFEQGGAAVGVSMARMNWADRNSPTRRAQVWNGSAWLPGSTRRVPQPNGTSANIFVYRTATPLMRAVDSWDGGSSKVDVYWGPSVHWNTSLGLYVMLLNRAISNEWAQRGIYVSFGQSLDDPKSWSAPEQILAGGSWYPQVIGLDAATGTDRQAGAVARFFMGGRSDYLIRFDRRYE